MELRMNPFNNVSTNINDFSNSCEVIDLTQFDLIFDFTCLHSHFASYFHFTFDCILANYEIFEALSFYNNSNSIALMPNVPKSTQYLDIFVPDRESSLLTFNYKKTNCFLLKSNSTVIYTPVKNFWIDHYSISQFPTNSTQIQRMCETSKKFISAINHYRVNNFDKNTPSLNSNNLMNKFDSNYDNQDKNTNQFILIISRSTTRTIRNEFQIAVKIKNSFPHLVINYFYGNESIPETIQLFSNAKFVIGFHGAGLANTLFCKKGTTVIEYSIAYSNANDLWRTNKEIAFLNDDIIWITYKLNLPQTKRLNYTYYFESKMQYVIVPDLDISLLVDFLEVNMSLIETHYNKTNNWIVLGPAENSTTIYG